MKKFSIVLMFCLGINVFAETKTFIIGEQTVNVRSSSMLSVNVQVGDCLLVFTEHQRDSFMKYLKVHIDLLTAVDKLTVREIVTENVLGFSLNADTYVNSSLVTSGSECKVKLYFRTNRAYVAVIMSKPELENFLEILTSMKEVNIADSQNRQDIKKAIFEAQTKFKLN